MNNYRPISILPAFSKCLEKIIYKRIVNFCSKHNLISSSQYGFLQGTSTETALLAQKEIILNCFEKKKYLCIGVFVDFSKAFDRLSHSTLFKKLDLYGIRGSPLLLMKSYFRYREQCVKIDNFISSFQSITTGVPQGSILGPLLFILYINDITMINDKPIYIMYADDTSIFFTGSNLQSLIPLVNNTLQGLQAWSEVNSLLINTNKTNAILFHTRQLPISLDCPLYLGNTATALADCVKTLGVCFHKNMSWDVHVDSTISSLCKCVAVLAKMRSFLPVPITLLIYNTLFLPHLNYCFLAWGSTTNTNLNKLYMLQKKSN